MPTYYVDPAAAGTDAGTSWTNAWTTLQRAIDGTGGTKPVAGDIVYCRGTQTVATMIDSDGNSGSVASGFVKFIGCNASGDVDGTQFVLNGNNNSLTAIVRLDADYIWFENIKFVDCGGSGAGVTCSNYVGSPTENVFVDCWFHSNAGAGFSFVSGAGGGQRLLFLRCWSTDNGGAGFANVRHGQFIFCKVTGNAGGGIDCQASIGGSLSVVESVVQGNTGVGLNCRNSSGFHLVFGSVIDGNSTVGVLGEGSLTSILASRITEQGTYGVNGSSGRALIGWCYMPASGQARDNATANTNGTTDIVNINGASTNDLAGTDANGGYANPTTNFALTSSATLRNQTVPIDANTTVYVSAGLSITGASAGGGVLVSQRRNSTLSRR
jgi:hypothetical protein